MTGSVIKANIDQEKGNIITFWKKNFPRWPADKFSWFYQKNPYGCASCWINKDIETNMIIGSTAIFPRKVNIKAELLLGGITGDFGVSEKYRTLGPALSLQRANIAACKEDQFDFLYGYPNKKSQPVQLRAGFKVVGGAYRMVRILRSDDYINRHINQAMLSKIISKPVDILQKVFSKESYYLKKRGVKFQF
ncbi:unnamed protein product, partial [marine sediment metagenome]